MRLKKLAVLISVVAMFMLAACNSGTLELPGSGNNERENINESENIEEKDTDIISPITGGGDFNVGNDYE